MLFNRSEEKAVGEATQTGGSFTTSVLNILRGGKDNANTLEREGGNNGFGFTSEHYKAFTELSRENTEAYIKREERQKQQKMMAQKHLWSQ